MLLPQSSPTRVSSSPAPVQATSLKTRPLLDSFLLLPQILTLLPLSAGIALQNKLLKLKFLSQGLLLGSSN